MRAQQLLQAYASRCVFRRRCAVADIAANGEAHMQPSSETVGLATTPANRSAQEVQIGTLSPETPESQFNADGEGGREGDRETETEKEKEKEKEEKETETERETERERERERESERASEREE